MYRNIAITIAIIMLLGTAAVFADDVGLQPGTLELTQRVVDEAELETLSLTRLTLLREGIYARHGETEFDAPWIARYFRAQPWYHAKGHVEQTALSGLERRNLYELAEYLGEDGDDVADCYDRRNAIFKHYDPGQPLSAADQLEVNLTWEVQRRIEWRTHKNISDGVIPMSVLRRSDRTALANLRNGIFARRGYRFQDMRIVSWYYRSQGYQPNPAWTPSMLTPIDWENIAHIQQVETEKGGPLQDVTFATRDGG